MDDWANREQPFRMFYRYISFVAIKKSVVPSVIMIIDQNRSSSYINFMITVVHDYFEDNLMYFLLELNE